MVKVDTLPDDDTKGNAESNNLAQKISDDKFKRDNKGYDEANPARPLSAAEQAAVADLEDSYADESISDEERRAALAANEAAGNGGKTYDSNLYQGNDLKSRALRMRGIKRGGATTGVAASIFFVGGIFLSMAGGSSFWTAFEKNLTNDASDDARINTELHRAFNAVFTRCKPGTLSCKFKTMTKEQVKKFKEGFVKIKGNITDEKGNPTRGSPNEVVDPDTMQPGERVEVSAADFSDGYEAKNVNDLNTHVETDIGARAELSRGFSPLADDFLSGNFNKQLSERDGINKAKATPEEEKTNNAKESVKPATEKAAQKASGSFKEKLLKAGTSSTAQLAQLSVDYACTAYNTTRIAVGAVKAKWTIDLIRFAWPFIRLASKIQDGSATNEDFQQIEDKFTQLVDYMSPTRAAELKGRVQSGSLTDVDKNELSQFGINLDDSKDEQIKQINEITDKNAFDSQGLQQVIYGNTNPITSFTKKFGTGIVGSATLGADFVVKSIQSWANFGGIDDLKSGKQNIKSFCKANKALGAIMAAGGLGEAGFDIINCFAAVGTVGVDIPSDLDCAKRVGIIAIKMGAYIAAIEAIGALMTTALVAAIIREAPQLPSDALRGPAAGDAIASGVALLLSHKAMSSGLKPAMSVVAVNQFISSTQTHYDQYGDQLAYYNARQTPLDASNRYSFLGQIMGAINPYPLSPGQQPSGFSYMANLFGFMSGTFNSSASALHSQPSLMTAQQADLAARTNNGTCDVDEEKKNLGMMCDATTGRTIQVASPRVLQWAADDAAGKSDHLTDAINWMQQKQPANEAEDSGGTQDETCTGLMSKIMDLMSLDWGNLGKCSDSGDLPSIDADGKPVPGSQYDKFVNYCRTKRELEYGSTDIDQGTGSAKEQAWHDGSQCGLTYDSDHNASTGDNFHKEKDTGKGSLMMDYFTYYYNMCNVQYATQNNATDCTNDTPPGGGSAATSTAGNGNIAETAKEMGTWGGQYQSCYTYGGGHGDTADLKKRIDAHFAGPENGVDCSGFVRAVIFQATGKDPGAMTTDSMCADMSKFEHIPRNSAQPGDLAIDCTDHVEVVVANNSGTFQTVGSHSTGCGPGYGASPGNFQGSGNFVLRYKG